MDKPYEKVGSVGEVTFAGMKVEVLALDYHFAYGNHRWLCTPIAGSGETWLEHVVFKDEEEVIPSEPLQTN